MELAIASAFPFMCCCTHDRFSACQLAHPTRTFSMAAIGSPGLDRASWTSPLANRRSSGTDACNNGGGGGGGRRGGRGGSQLMMQCLDFVLGILHGLPLFRSNITGSVNPSNKVDGVRVAIASTTGFTRSGVAKPRLAVMPLRSSSLSDTWFQLGGSGAFYADDQV